jgi:rhamnosyltransferase
MSLNRGSRKIRVAILGSRGIPARYGGYETIAEELSLGLAQKGFDVYVSCESKGFKMKPYGTFKAARLVFFPVINSIRSISEVIVYDALSVFWATFNVDIIYMLAYTSVPTLIFPRIFRKVVVVNVDGLEWRRRKHNKVLRFLLRSFEILNLKIANCIVVDSRTLGAYYEKTYKVKPAYVPYGIKEIKPLDSRALRNHNLEKNGYYLMIARLEPENNIDLVIEEFKKSDSRKKLVIVGPLKKASYITKLLQSRSERILFLGGIYEPKLQRMLRHNCFAYIHGHEVGGTNPTLVEALSCHNVIIALDVAFNREVAGEGAVYFTKNAGDLKKKIEMLENSEFTSQLNELRKKAYENYRSRYGVEDMDDAYEALFERILEC